MIQRIRDWLYERRIRAVSKRWTAAMEAKDYADARRISAELDKLRLARSPEQIARLERAQFNRLDPQARRIFMQAKERERQP